VLRRTAIEIAKRLEWSLEPSRSGFLPDSVQRWKPFRETSPQLQKLSKKYKLGLLSNIDDKLLGQTRRHIAIDFDLVVTASRCAHTSRNRLTSPSAPAASAASAAGCTWQRVTTTTSPLRETTVPVIWVNRNKETLDSSQKKPTAEVANLREPPSCSVSPRPPQPA